MVILFGTIHANTDRYLSDYGFTKLTEFVFLTIPVVLIILVSGKLELIRSIAYGIFLVSALLFLIGVYASLKSGFHFTDQNRLAIMGGGPIVYARWIVAGILFLFFCIRQNIFLKLFFISIAVILLLFSGSKGPIVSLIIAIAIYLVIAMKWSYRSFRLVIFAGAGLVLILALLIPALNHSNLIPDRMAQLGNISKLENARSTVSRLERYPVSLEIFYDHPLGVGAGNWAYHHNLRSEVMLNEEDYPHNLMVELLNEFGLFAFLLFAILLAGILIRMVITFSLIKNNFNHNAGLTNHSLFSFMSVYFIYYFINSNISGDLSDGRFVFIAMASIIAISTEISGKKKQQTGY